MGESVKVIANNKKAYHDYFIEEKYEAGISLYGTEVKSIRAGRLNIKDSFCLVDHGELYVYNMHISPYEQGNIFNKDPDRPKKLLMHRREIMRLLGLTKQNGMALIPTSVYFKGKHIKVEIGLAKGKKLYDKREDAAKRDAAREMDKQIKERNNR